jgi:hypothetical protein
LDKGDGDIMDPLDSSTKATDISCRDDQYSESEAGIKFRNCLECLATSDAVEGEESDLHWYLCKSSNGNHALSTSRQIQFGYSRCFEKTNTQIFKDNLRYTLSTCLFGFPGTAEDSQVQSPCIIDHACRPLEKPLIEDGLEPEVMDTFGYCEAEEGAFMVNKTWTCRDCLRASAEQTYLANCKSAKHRCLRIAE